MVSADYLPELALTTAVCLALIAGASPVLHANGGAATRAVDAHPVGVEFRNRGADARTVTVALSRTDGGTRSRWTVAVPAGDRAVLEDVVDRAGTYRLRVNVTGGGAASAVWTVPERVRPDAVGGVVTVHANDTVAVRTA